MHVVGVLSWGLAAAPVFSGAFLEGDGGAGKEACRWLDRDCDRGICQRKQFIAHAAVTLLLPPIKLDVTRCQFLLSHSSWGGT